LSKRHAECTDTAACKGTQFTRFTGTQVQILTLLQLSKHHRRLQKVLNLHLLYWYKNTNPDTAHLGVVAVADVQMEEKAKKN
jgi:hypothetical protein